jgi:tetratricopeptide (TPR) repeat protein
MSGTANVDDIALALGSGGRWAMVRTHFGIGSFGVNAYVADEAETELVGEHDELGETAGKHEELYVVTRGHATFTVNGDEIDAPAGTFVFVRDPAAKRSAVAKADRTTVLIVGGKPGEAFTPSRWERNAPALAHFVTKDYDQAIEAFEQLLAETPDDGGVLYNLACAESLAGRSEDALSHLRRAVELESRFAELAEKDSDFDPIRDVPEFASAIAGKSDAGSSSS